MHEAGQSIRAIANNLGISTRTVRRWIRRYSPENVFHVARSGHVTVNIWKWVSWHGMGDMHQIEALKFTRRGALSCATYRYFKRAVLSGLMPYRDAKISRQMILKQLL
ncbi:hypothetical protein Pcinc_016626 [Petrolisthes cinctipes]|uniref:Uncharacterized protein n=1 Tax=Petrolisthes cinctipes TaxID=88211 RepID=A0AAE1FS60_PETCI|nr:hypothetical protein Pcinc_016626 [Petrolisthes cinctipes]